MFRHGRKALGKASELDELNRTESPHLRQHRLSFKAPNVFFFLSPCQPLLPARFSHIYPSFLLPSTLLRLGLFLTRDTPELRPAPSALCHSRSLLSSGFFVTRSGLLHENTTFRSLSSWLFHQPKPYQTIVVFPFSLSAVFSRSWSLVRAILSRRHPSAFEPNREHSLFEIDDAIPFFGELTPLPW